MTDRNRLFCALFEAFQHLVLSPAGPAGSDDFQADTALGCDKGRSLLAFTEQGTGQDFEGIRGLPDDDPGFDLVIVAHVAPCAEQKQQPMRLILWRP